METPPRAWGRPVNSSKKHSRVRNTPTGVGKTFYITKNGDTPKKHPHGRGEDICRLVLRLLLLETPPRAWGRLSGRLKTATDARNTPTGVGKT